MLSGYTDLQMSGLLDSDYLLISDNFQVHIRVASPPIRHPCYMGINIPTKEELIVNKIDLDGLASHFGK